MRRLAFDEIRVIIEYADVDCHNNIIKACKFTEEQARYYGAVTNYSMISGECIDISPRHAQQIIDLFPHTSIHGRMIIPLIRMVASYRGHVCISLRSNENCKGRKILHQFQCILEHNTDRSTWADNFETMWTSEYCAKSQNAHLYSPTRYWRIADKITVENYVEDRKCSFDEIVYVTCMALEKRWRMSLGWLIKKYNIHTSPIFIEKLKAYPRPEYIRECPLEVACMLCGSFSKEYFSTVAINKYGECGLERLARTLTHRRKNGLPIDMKDIDKYIYGSR